MTLILKLDLEIVKMYHHTKSEVSMSTVSKDENITSAAYAGGNNLVSNVPIELSTLTDNRK